MTEKRYGADVPTVWITLPYEHTRGSEAVAAYAETGKTALTWQERQINAILATDENGQYIHRRYGMAVPRRNGKNEVVVMREIYALQHGEKVLHTAHLTTTSSDAAARLGAELDAMGYIEVKRESKDDVYDHHYKFRKQYGLEVITLLGEGGGSVSFRTRTSKGGLGTNTDVLIIDEAQEYLKEQDNTLKFLISDSKNRQMILCGTPPTAVSSGTVFKSFRRDVLDGKAKYSGWAEWSVPTQTDVRNVDAWYASNPSLGYVFGEDAVELEIGDDDLDFNIQRLGLWIDYNLASAITEKEWRLTECKQVPELTGGTFIGVKYGANGDSVALSVACKTTDGNVFVSAYDVRSVREGNDWIVKYISSIKSLDRVVVDGKGRSEILEKDMRQAGLRKPVIPSSNDFCVANSQFEQAVFNNGLRHMPQPALDIAVTNCEKKLYGNRGAFIYVSNVETVDITIMESAVLAFWLCSNTKEQRGQRVGY